MICAMRLPEFLILEFALDTEDSVHELFEEVLNLSEKSPEERSDLGAGASLLKLYFLGVDAGEVQDGHWEG